MAFDMMKMRQKIGRGCFFLLILVLSACGREPQVPSPELYQRSTVRDLLTIPQNLDFFAQQAGPDKLLYTPERQQEHVERLRSRFFAPWSLTEPGKGHVEYFIAQLDRKGSQRGYAENLQPWDDGRWLFLRRNANFSRFPSLARPAVTIEPANVRLAPTNRPRFVHPTMPGQGFPFDEFQQTALPTGVPVMVMHRSLNGQWLYVETPVAPGWIASSSVAYVDEDFRARWESLPLAVIIHDDVILEEGDLLTKAHVGTLLPLVQEEDHFLTVLVPYRRESGDAAITQVRLSSENAASLPIKPTPANFAMIGKDLLDQPYGWGGMFQNRDCSSMLRDLFIPFGIWLPRNSADQAKAGNVIKLTDLSLEEKHDTILEYGQAFVSLLWLPGHIGVYLGEYNGQAVMFHNIWGLRTKEQNDVEGRHILGRAVITSTRPGWELPQVKEDRLLINRMESLTIIE